MCAIAETAIHRMKDSPKNGLPTAPNPTFAWDRCAEGLWEGKYQLWWVVVLFVEDNLEEMRADSRSSFRSSFLVKAASTLSFRLCDHHLREMGMMDGRWWRGSDRSIAPPPPRLIAHSNTTHASKPIPLDFHSLSSLKKVVPKSEVCVIRPAFTETGDQTDFLNYLSNGTSIGETKPQEVTPGQKTATPDGTEYADVDSETRKFIEQAAFAMFSQSINFAMPTTAPNLPVEQTSPPLLTTVSKPTLPGPSNSSDSTKPNIKPDNTRNSDSQSPESPPNTSKKMKRSTPYATRTQKKQACPTCGELFDNRCQLTLHMMKHKRVSHPFECPMTGCFQCYDTRAKIRSHLQRVHRGLTINNIESLVLKCEAPKSRQSVGTDRDMESVENKMMNPVEQLVDSIQKRIKQENVSPTED
uniref:C2H2-type domain-containing protein n=1 Tax=Panagrellus redivivus TaxID=6233 RepID=A0A7E4V7M3_PANRE